ncbi:hypothetical protein QOZ97_000476 [Qipengyuania citrea]|uniref:Uncharacterized protein n=1 Tax=Qipengyuania citrea TaxID=225971 RepID=A0ABU0N6A2_9SPHN|nr:hypothetical protein [Qipengyuania citrea]
MHLGLFAGRQIEAKGLPVFPFHGYSSSSCEKAKPPRNSLC